MPAVARASATVRGESEDARSTRSQSCARASRDPTDDRGRAHPRLEGHRRPRALSARRTARAHGEDATVSRPEVSSASHMLRRSSSPELLDLELLDTEVAARPPRRADAILTVESLSARLGRRIVIRDVDLHVGAGEIVALVGHNGSGKTTTLRVVAGLTPPERGVVEIAGESSVRYVPTERAVFADLSVRDNLWLGAGRVPPAVRAARVDSVLSLFPELRSRIEQRAGVLSGGEQRLVAFAIALMGE